MPWAKLSLQVLPSAFLLLLLGAFHGPDCEHCVWCLGSARALPSQENPVLSATSLGGVLQAQWSMAYPGLGLKIFFLNKYSFIPFSEKVQVIT